MLTDATYERRGWTRNGVPTMDMVKKLSLDWIPEIVDIVKKYEGTEPPKDTLPTSGLDTFSQIVAEGEKDLSS